MRISLTSDDLDTLEHCLNYCVVQIDAQIGNSNTQAFALRLARTKIGKLREKLFPGRNTKQNGT